MAYDPDSQFLLPPEWHRQRAVLLTWPHAQSDWLPWLGEVEGVYLNLIEAITCYQEVLLLVDTPANAQRIRGLLAERAVALERVHSLEVPTNDTWVRDYGPLTVMERGRPFVLTFYFNGWGEQFAADLDNNVVRRLYAKGVFGAAGLGAVDMVLEGGAIDVDGEGTLLTTASCLLSPQRNPYLTRQDYETAFRQWFGVDRVLWLQHGQLIGDDTGGHIDTLARFCDAHTIAYTRCEDPEDEQFQNLRAMEQELAAFCDRRGEAYRLVPLPLPQPQIGHAARRLPATYANFLIINQAVLVPIYGDPADSIALDRLRDCFPERTVLGIHCRALLEQNGSLHCVTMQIPAELAPIDSPSAWPHQ